MKTRTPYLLIFLLTALLAGCTKEIPMPEEPLSPVPEGEALLTFSLRFPEPVVLGPATKAMADTPTITSLKIAVFGSSGFLKEYRDVESFQAATTNSTITNNVPSPVYTFRTKMNLTDSKNLRIHIIANGPDKLPWLYEDAALCSGAYTTGTNDAYWCRFVLPNGVMAKREYNETTQAMEYVKRQDPVDEQWYFVVDDSVEALFQNLPLVRNFAKLTVESTTPQLVLNPTTTVAVVNIPDRGSVAPYNALTSQFMSGYKDISYADMINEYPGYAPNDMAITQTDPSTVPFTNGSIYMYERPIPTSNPTYLIIHGTYYPKVLDGEGKPTYDENHNLVVDTSSPTDCYYRIDLTDDNGYYAIYRNFRYRIRITGVSKAGASTPAAAGSTGGSGDVSSNTEAQGLTDISDGYGRIMVEYTSKTLVEETAEVTLKYKFIPDVEHDTPDNDAVTITINPGGSAGDVIKNTTTISTTGRTTVDGDGHGIIVVDTADDTNDGFRTLRFSTNRPDVLKKNQTIRISGHVNPTTVVYRDITYYLMERQTMAVSCTPSVEDVMGQQVNVNIGIPKDLPESMFPLVFNIEAEKLSITPYISSEWADENLPVESGTTLVPNKSYPSFHFKRTLSYDEYSGTGLYAGRGLPDGDGGVVMTCHFKTNKDQSASNIYVSNEYFNKGGTQFTNYHVYNFTNLKFNRNWLTAVGSPVNFSFYMDSSDPQLETGRNVEVRLDGLVPANNDVLTLLPGTTNRYTYRHANSNPYVTLALKTDTGFNGEYSVYLSSGTAYHSASLTNTDLPKTSFEGGSFSNVLYGNGWPTTFSFTIPDSFEMPGEGIDIELGLTNLIPNDGNITERNGKYYYHTTTKGAKTLNLKTANDRSAAVAVELNSDAFETLTSTQATRQYLNIAAGRITNVGPNNAFRNNQNTVYIYTNKNSTGQVASYKTNSTGRNATSATNSSAANFASNIVDATTTLYLSMYSNYNQTTYRATTTAETLYNNGNATTVTFSNAAFGTRTVTIDTTDSNFSTGNSTYSLGDVTVTFSNLGEVDESYVYMIAGSTLTVSVPSGLHITDMTISYLYDYYYPRTVNVSSGGGTYSNGTWTAANTSTTRVVLTMSNPRDNYILPSSIVVTVVEN